MNPNQVGGWFQIRAGCYASIRLCNALLSVTSILLTQRQPRVVGAIRQDENIDAISLAVGIGVRGLIAGIGVGGVFARVACLGIVVQPVCNMDGRRGARAA